MNNSMRQIKQQQDAALKEMGEIRVMRRGTLSRQEYRQRRARKGGKGASGPYFVWQGYTDGKHFSQRVPSRNAERIGRKINARTVFERLCAEYVRLGEVSA